MEFWKFIFFLQIYIALRCVSLQNTNILFNCVANNEEKWTVKIKFLPTNKSSFLMTKFFLLSLDMMSSWYLENLANYARLILVTSVLVFLHLGCVIYIPVYRLEGKMGKTKWKTNKTLRDILLTSSPKTTKNEVIKLGWNYRARVARVVNLLVTFVHGTKIKIPSDI